VSYVLKNAKVQHKNGKSGNTGMVFGISTISYVNKTG
jgi:hypothetical protein